MVGIHPDHLAGHLLESPANAAGDSAGWPSPRSETIDSSAREAGDLGESDLRNRPESGKDQLRIDPPPVLDERLGDVLSGDETCDQVSLEHTLPSGARLLASRFRR